MPSSFEARTKRKGSSAGHSPNSTIVGIWQLALATIGTVRLLAGGKVLR